MASCSYTRHTRIYLWVSQDASGSLIFAAINGNLPAVEYLVERGADVAAKNNVNDVIIDVKLHTPHEYTCECISLDTLH